MSRLLLLADSNFLNNIGDYAGRKISGLEVKNCQTRKSIMSELNLVDEGIVVLSCLDMIAADIIKSTPSDAERSIEVYYNQLLFKLIEKVDDSDGKLAFGVVAPLFWSSINEEARRAMNHTYKLMKASPLQGIILADYLRGVRGGADGTHLTSRSAEHYIERVHEVFGQVAAASGLGPVVLQGPQQQVQPVAEANDWAMDLTMTTDEEAVTEMGPPVETVDVLEPTRSTTMLSASILQPPSRGETMLLPEFSRTNLGETQSRLMRLASYPDTSVPPPIVGSNRTQNQGMSEAMRISKLERRVGCLEDTTFHNNIMMAALKEEQDTEANKALLNRVTFSGMVIEDLLNMNEENRIKAMKTAVMEIVDSLKDPEQVFELLFVRHLNRKNRGQKSAVIEAKFADPKQTRELRAKFVEKHKALKLKINITPVVRLATRVRVEMMHSIANLMLRQDRTIEKAMCVQFIPKPVIKIVRKSVGGTEAVRTISFTDSVTWIKEQGLESQLDLVKARSKAGATFRGTMAQHFVIMD